MPLKWKQGNLQTLARVAGRQREEFPRIAQEIVSDLAKMGEEEQRNLLDKAVTAGGAERFSRGRGQSAGRRDTDEMYQAITSDTELSKNSATGSWGWLHGAKDYFGLQDWIIGNGGAHSLLDSYVIVRSEFVRRMKDLVR